MKCPSALPCQTILNLLIWKISLNTSSFKLTLYYKNLIDMFNERLFVIKDIKGLMAKCEMPKY